MTRSTIDGVSVAVIGAGFSGLRCADVLLRSGAKVKVYEARDRIGGRVHQTLFGGHLVDLGANWIHSPEGNPMKDLADRVNAVIFSRPKDQGVVGSDGKRRPDEVAVWMHRKRLEIIDKAHDYSAEHRSEIDADTSLLDFFKQELGKDLKDQPDLAEDMLHEAYRWGQMVGESVDKQSLKYLSMEDDGPGGIDGFVASSYKDIMDLISKPVLERDVIQVGAEVKHIVSETAPERASNILETADGTRETFDEVVVTCPLGWLKENKSSAFTPSLPSRLSQAIDNLNYGHLEKIYVTFPSAFWLEGPGDWKPPCFTHFHDPSYVSHPSTIPSNLIAISLAHLPAPVAQPTLLFYMYGAFGTQVISSVKDLSPQSDAYNAILEEFTHPYYSRMPNYSAENPSCKPVSYLCTMWQFDPFAGYGSYSHFRTGANDTIADVEQLRDAGGMGETRGIWFAGEHTAPFGVMATTAGAYISGERVAEKICKKRGLQMVKED